MVAVELMSQFGAAEILVEAAEILAEFAARFEAAEILAEFVELVEAAEILAEAAGSRLEVGPGTATGLCLDAVWLCC